MTFAQDEKRVTTENRILALLSAMPPSVECSDALDTLRLAAAFREIGRLADEMADVIAPQSSRGWMIPMTESGRREL